MAKRGALDVGLLQAGVARRTITPPVGIWMMGYANRVRGGSEVHDDLTATAVVLGDGRARAAIVSCDLIFLHPKMVSEIRSRVAAQTGIPAERVMLCCSHTHSGPVTWHAAGAARDRAQLDPYLGRLVDQISSAVRAAAEDLCLAAWGSGRGQATIGVNRRQRLAGGGIGLGANPGGVVDPELSVVRIDEVDAQGRTKRPLVTLVNYACHAVCLSSNSYAFSADWPGVMRRRVEAETGSTVGFVQGACADINPLGGPQDTFDSALRLGELAAKEALRVYSEIRLTRTAVLRGTRRVLDLPLGWGPLALGDPHDGGFRELASRVTGIPAAQVMDWLEERFPWSADLCPSTRCARMEVQALGMGDVALVGMAGF